jgi:5-methylcytosine-specific restriction endonuclease McrA
MDKKRYPKDWDAIALKIKISAEWKCQRCGKQCLRPSDDSTKLTRSEWGKATLTVHHIDLTPENRANENLIALCAPCHLKVHALEKKPKALGQLSLNLEVE